MSKHSNDSTAICKAYPGTRMLDGCAMDADSYERHCQARQAAAPDPSPDTAPVDPFAQEQDFRAIAAKAFEQDRTAMQPQHSDAPAAEYRPGTVQFIPWERLEIQAPQRLLLPAGTLIVRGSGSYVTSGSYYLTSGSYRLSSGSYLRTSGSYYLTSRSYRLSSGSYRLSSGSYRLSSGSYRLSSGSYRPTSESHSVPCEDTFPVISSSMQLLGGYGLGAI